MLAPCILYHMPLSLTEAVISSYGAQCKTAPAVMTEIGKTSARWRRRLAPPRHRLPGEPVVLSRQGCCHESLREGFRCNLLQPAALFLASAARSSPQTTAAGQVLTRSSRAALPVLAGTGLHLAHWQ